MASVVLISTVCVVMLENELVGNMYCNGIYDGLCFYSTLIFFLCSGFLSINTPCEYVILCVCYHFCGLMWCFAFVYFYMIYKYFMFCFRKIVIFADYLTCCSFDFLPRVLLTFDVKDMCIGFLDVCSFIFFSTFGDTLWERVTAVLAIFGSVSTLERDVMYIEGSEPENYTQSLEENYEMFPYVFALFTQIICIIMVYEFKTIGVRYFLRRVLFIKMFSVVLLLGLSMFGFPIHFVSSFKTMNTPFNNFDALRLTLKRKKKLKSRDKHKIPPFTDVVYANSVPFRNLEDYSKYRSQMESGNVVYKFSGVTRVTTESAGMFKFDFYVPKLESFLVFMRDKTKSYALKLDSRCTDKDFLACFKLSCMEIFRNAFVEELIKRISIQACWFLVLLEIVQKLFVSFLNGEFTVRTIFIIFAVAPIHFFFASISITNAVILHFMWNLMADFLENKFGELSVAKNMSYVKDYYGIDSSEFEKLDNVSQQTLVDHYNKSNEQYKATLPEKNDLSFLLGMFAESGISDMYKENEETISFVSMCVILLRSIQNKDKITFIASILAFPNKAKILSNFCDSAEVLYDVCSALWKEDEIQLTGPLPEYAFNPIAKFMSMMGYSSESRSPVVKSLFVISSLLFGSFFTEKFEYLLAFLQKCFSFVKVKEMSADIATSVVEAIMNVIKGMKAWFETGDLKNFFIDPASYIRLARIQSVLTSTPLSAAELIVSIGQADVCVRMIDQFHEHENMLAPLFAKILTWTRVLGNMSKRSVPLVFYLFGLPGTGKTTVTDYIIKLHEMFKGNGFEHSILYADLAQKYPMETAICDSYTAMIFSDIPNDFTLDVKNGKVDTMCYMQRAMDTVGFMVNSASVEKKTWSFNKTELIIFTSNSRVMKFVEDCSKLVRRYDEYCAILEVAQLDDNGNPQPYNEAQPLEQYTARMNMRFMKAYGKNNYLEFQEQHGKWFNLNVFKRYCEDLFSSREDEAKKMIDYTQSECCHGYSYKFHSREMKTWQIQPCSPGCNIVDACDVVTVDKRCRCGLYSQYHSQYPPGILACSKIADIVLDCDKIRKEKDEESEFTERDIREVKTRRRKGGGPLHLELDMISILVIVFFLFFFHEYSNNNFLVACYCCIFLMFLGFIVWYNVRPSFVRVHNLLSQVENIVMRGDQVSSKILYNTIVVENKLKLAEEKWQKFFPRIKMVLALSGTVTIIYYLIKLWYAEKRLTAPLHENVDRNMFKIGVFTTEENYPPELRTEWKKPGNQFFRAVINKPNVDSITLEKKLLENTCKMTYPAGDGSFRTVTGTFISPQFILANTHYFPDLKRVDLVVEFKGRPFSIAQAQFAQVESSRGLGDALLIHAGNIIPGAHNLFDYFAEDVNLGFKSKIHYPYKNETGVGTFAYRPSCNAKAQNKDVVLPSGVYLEAPVSVSFGDCGNLLLAQTIHDSFIVGPVSYMIGPISGASCVFRSDLLRAVAKFHVPVVAGMMYEGKNLEEMQPLNIKSSYRDMSNTNFCPIGTLPVVVNTFRTSLVPSVLHDVIKPLTTKEFAIPKNTKGVVDGEYQDAFIHTMGGINEFVWFDAPAMEQASDIYLKHIIEEVEKVHGKVDSSPVELIDGLLGRSGVIDRSNLNSSMGWNKFGLKVRLDIFTCTSELFDDITNESYGPVDGFVSELSEYLLKIKEGMVPIIHVKACYKDEILPKEKVDAKKIRMFYIPESFFNLLSRCYLGPLRALLLKIPQISKIFAGINSSSKEWDQLAKHIKIFNPDYFNIDMDFRKMDISHHPQILYLVAKFFYRLALHFYKNEENALVCFYLVLGVVVKLLEHNGDIALVFGCMPSGWDCTLIVNSIINVMLMIYGFIKLGLNPEEFFVLVFPAVLGDDNTAGVHKSLREVFNIVTLAPIYKKAGYNISNASKSEILEPVVSPEKVIFAKRGFRKDNNTGTYLAPLDENSIFKSLMFISRHNKSGMSEEQLLSQTCEGLQGEFFQYGRERYEWFQNTFLPTIAHVVRFDVKNYDELLDMYNNSSLPMMWV